ncbi:type II secretion system protein N [Sphingobium sp. CCH11-B1]|jgi:general secretion pathway protein C|uniref:type II secretion system protein N n=1 Tax=Sphingobium sp. CCH11-B1 TaxID=1768781 RepID=UPI0008366620|nr:type II secretion system protein N [Sphingobium sp. CCH11-B1]MEA3390993.1 type II secretion system protein N [Pseudomonadota bacterium]
MQVPFGDRVRGLRRRRTSASPAFDWLALLERALLILLALMIVRLAWAIVTPVGSFGPWEGRRAQLMSASARQALFASFDPFFRDGPQQPSGGVVTSLALTVYGIRLNEGSGLGSAIIAGPDGVQNSFAVGDEILPGVVLKSVAFDHVTIDRGGAEEQVFLDQSTPAPDAPAPPPAASGWQSAAPPPPPATATGAGPTAESLKRDIGFAPRIENGRVTGLVVQSRGPAFAGVGFKPGDIIAQVNGQPVGDLQSLQNQIAPGARLSLTVERGATTASVNLIVQGQ